MGADFAMLIGCDVRDAFFEDSMMATEALVAEIKQRSSLDAVLRINESGSMPLSVLKVVNGPDGMVETTISLDDMMASVKRLAAMAARCDAPAAIVPTMPFAASFVASKLSPKLSSPATASFDITAPFFLASSDIAAS